MLVVSLTSIPPRFDHLGPTLESLCGQRRSPDRIRLYVAETYRRFPDWDGTVPCVPDGVEIRRMPDYGPATKLLGALADGFAPETQIVFCDDDRIYDASLTERLTAEAARRPGCSIAENGYHLTRYGVDTGEKRRQPRAIRRMRVTDWRFQLAFLWQDATHPRTRHLLREPPRRCNRRAGYVDVFEGSGGVLVTPSMFDADVFNIPKPAWTVDDIWLSGQLERCGVPIWLQANILEQRFSQSETAAPLSGSVNTDATNRDAVRHMQETYGIWT